MIFHLLVQITCFYFLHRTDPRGLNGNLKAHQGGSCRIHGPVKSGPAAACGPAAVTAVGRGTAAVTAVGRGGTAAAAQHLQDYQLDHTYDPVAADDPGRATYMGKSLSSLLPPPPIHHCSVGLLPVISLLLTNTGSRRCGLVYP
jgi:hypothetical protein